MYVLAQGVKTGIYRVCNELYIRLAKRNDINVQFLYRSETKKASSNYLKLDCLSHNQVNEKKLSRLKQPAILISPFGPAPKVLLDNKKILHCHIIYDLIAINRPDLFTYEASTEVRKILESLTQDTLIFAISNFTRQDLLKYREDLSPDQVIVIPLAAGKQFKPCTDLTVISAVKQRYKIPVNCSYILSLATLEIRKNLNRVVDSFILYMNKHPESNLHLVLAGMSGWKLESLNQSLAAAGHLRERIILTGFVEDDHLSAIYSGASCFMYLSQYEGFGLPPLEAMACGTPVICANNSSMPEVVGNAAILVDSESVTQASDAIHSIASSRKLQIQLSENGLERAKMFNWDVTTDIIVNALKNYNAKHIL